MIGRQLPVYSPLSLGAIVGAGGDALLGGDRAIRALEDHARARFAATSMVLTASGTHALQLALAVVWSRRKAEGPVALPGYSCFDVVTAAVGAGVSARFYDLDPRTLSPDLESLREVVAGGVAAVVVGNLYGYPIDWGGVREICDRAAVPVIEDAAQGLGSRTPLGATGTLGDLTVLSFGRGKGWTGGGGGALLSRTRPAHEPAETTWPVRDVLPPDVGSGFGIRSALVTLAAWGLGRPSLYGVPASLPGLGLGETRYHEPSTPAPISRFSAALAGRTAAAARESVDARRRLAGALIGSDVRGDDSHAAAPVDFFRPCEPIGGTDSASYLRLPGVASSGEAAGRLAERGVRHGLTRGYPTALHQLPESRGLQAESPTPLPGAERLASCLVTVPTHGQVGRRHVLRIRALLRGP